MADFGSLFRFHNRIKHDLRWPVRRISLFATLGLLIFITAVLGWIYWKAANTLKAAQKELAAEREHAFTVIHRQGTNPNPFSWVNAPPDFSDAAVFQRHLYACGAAGLFEYDPSGKLVKHFRPGQELPPTSLLRMATGSVGNATEPELLIATAGEGVLAFNGTAFRQIRPADAEDRDITAILPLRSRQLLIGTRKHGVLIYDGNSLRAFHPTLAALNVTELAGTSSDLWVGTMDQGIFHWVAGRAEKFSEAEGLPDKQVFAIALHGSTAYVGTALGIAEFDGGQFKRVLASGTFARTLLAGKSKLLAGSMESGVSEIDLQTGRRALPLPITLPEPLPSIQRIVAAPDSTLAVTTANIYVRNGKEGWHSLLSPEAELLSDRNISALALDGSGRLWVGYFDHGLDLLDRDFHAASHIEDEHTFCVNRILTGSPDQGVAVGTANGLVLFDRWGIERQVLGHAQGLIADHVTDVARYGDGLVLATPAGLTFLDRNGARSLYAFQGLVNNHVYSVATAGRQMVAGTLGGISVLEGEHVVGNFTVTTPGLQPEHKLRRNWIAAVARTGDDWVIGTYGGGIVRLSQAGRFDEFELATGDFEVYPNAMLTTANHVLAGTLGRGLYSLNRSTNRWSVITEGLPSMTVTALAAGNGTIYVGTDNGLVRIQEQSLP